MGCCVSKEDPAILDNPPKERRKEVDKIDKIKISKGDALQKKLQEDMKNDQKVC